jgi:hypothetical protein
MFSNQVKYFMPFFVIFFVSLSVLSQSDHIKIEHLAKQLQTLSKNAAPELAFKAKNKDGTPVDIKGTLFEEPLPLVKFKSTHAGMGKLEFTPGCRKKVFHQD